MQRKFETPTTFLKQDQGKDKDGSSVVKRWKGPKCPSSQEWVNKMHSQQRPGFYSTIKQNKELIVTTGL